MEFVQCVERQGSNVKCHPGTKKWEKNVTNYCSRQLVKPDAPVKYMAQNGEVAEE